MQSLEHFEGDQQCLAKLKAIGSQHADREIRLMASVLTRLLAERVCESTEADFRAGMAKGEYSSDIAANFSHAIADAVLGQE